MSFLLRRNLPLAYAEWHEDFSGYAVGPIVQPWVHLGDGSPADIDSLHRLHIPSNYLTVDAGGESYEFEPFTPNWGVEMDLLFPVTGIASQTFSMYLTDSWAKIGGAFQDCVGIRLVHAPVVGGDRVQVIEFKDPLSVNFSFTAWNSPVTFNGNALSLGVWVDDDQFVRVWLNGTYLGSVVVDAGYRFTDTRRCVRFLDAALCDVWVTRVDHYDRPSSFPSLNSWTEQIFVDDFERSDGAVGGDWTQYGSDAQLSGGVWVHTGGTDDSCAIVRGTGIANNPVRITGTIRSPNNTADCSLYLLANTSTPAALAANVYGNKVYLSVLSGSFTSPTWHDLSSRTSGISVADGDRIGLGVYGSVAFLEVNGERVAYAIDIGSAISLANSGAGARVSHRSFNASGGWDDIRIYSGV